MPNATATALRSFDHNGRVKKGDIVTFDSLTIAALRRSGLVGPDHEGGTEPAPKPATATADAPKPTTGSLGAPKQKQAKTAKPAKGGAKSAASQAGQASPPPMSPPSMPGSLPPPLPVE